MVGFLSVFPLIWETCKIEWHSRGPSTNFLVEFVYEMKDNITLEKKDFGYIFLFAAVLTFCRQHAADRFLKPLAERLQFRPKDKAIFPESSFKLLLYLTFYTAECVILLKTYPEFLTDPLAPWRGWHIGMSVSSDIYWIYLTEAGFYIHGIYGIFFMDVWRDDSIMMVFHHILTVSLIVFSLGLRYHRIGLIVLFLHDIADVFLEFTKIMKCFQNREKKRNSNYAYIVNLGFIGFALSWIICRIFIYPITVLFSGGHEGRKILPDAPFYFFFNGLLWILYVMNLYWLCYIILLIYRVATNKTRGIEDPREQSIAEEQFSQTDKNTDADLQGRRILVDEQRQTNSNVISNGTKVNGNAGNWNGYKISNKYDDTVIFELGAKKEHFH